MYETIFGIFACDTSEGISCKFSQQACLYLQKEHVLVRTLLPVGFPLNVSSTGSKHLLNSLLSTTSKLEDSLSISFVKSKPSAGTYLKFPLALLMIHHPPAL